jgi:2-hydroxy-3-keto-5-methylthiopentenyl-1-phosphate phosphatase
MDNEIIKNVLKQITYEQLIESGLSRVYQHIQQHDIAIISAARKYVITPPMKTMLRD